MARSNRMAKPAGLESRHTYKKLGTVVEHILESINPMFYELRITVSSTMPLCTVMTIYTLSNSANPVPMPVWQFVWSYGFNSKIYIDPNLLHPQAEW